MLGLSVKDSWMVTLIALSVGAFVAAARCPDNVALGRAIIPASVGFSLAFMLLALLIGLAVLR